jgi:hypothetical protein
MSRGVGWLPGWRVAGDLVTQFIRGSIKRQPPNLTHPVPLCVSQNRGPFSIASYALLSPSLCCRLSIYSVIPSGSRVQAECDYYVYYCVALVFFLFENSVALVWNCKAWKANCWAQSLARIPPARSRRVIRAGPAHQGTASRFSALQYCWVSLVFHLSLVLVVLRFSVRFCIPFFSIGNMKRLNIFFYN